MGKTKTDGPRLDREHKVNIKEVLQSTPVCGVLYIAAAMLAGLVRSFAGCS